MGTIVTDDIDRDKRRAYIERPRCGCALAGAMTTITALPNAVPILHASPGCAGNTTWTQMGGGGLQVGGYCGSLSVGSTNVQEREVVFGGTDKLNEQIRNTLKVLKGDLYVIASGCVPAMIGDDVQAAASEFIEAGAPLVIANTAGFKGCAHLGYELVLEGIISQFVKKSAEKKKGKVNLLGIVPNWDVFWRGNIAALRELLESLGLTVNSFFSAEDSVESIRGSGDAELSIVVSGSYGINAAKKYESIHGIPWISLPLPIGPSATNEFLQTVGTALGISKRRINSSASKGESDYYRYVSTLVDCYSDMDLQRYAVVIGDSNYAAAIPRFLAGDIGWLPELVICTEPLLDADARERISNAINVIDEALRPDLVFDSDVVKAPEYLEKRWAKKVLSDKYKNPMSPSFVIGSSFDRNFALSIGAAHLSLSFPVSNRAVLDRSYAGYGGGLHLIEDLISAIIPGR